MGERAFRTESYTWIFQLCQWFAELGWFRSAPTCCTVGSEAYAGLSLYVHPRCSPVVLGVWTRLAGTRAPVVPPEPKRVRYDWRPFRGTHVGRVWVSVVEPQSTASTHQVEFVQT